MKKICFFLGFMLLLTTSLFAQRAAVMEFKAGVGISQSDVDGLSGMFTTYFRPVGFTMVERTQIDRIISEQGFQRSSLTEAQMVKIGEILNLSMIVIGDINVVAGEYNVDVRVVNVESGVIIATDGESFKGSYRESMKKLAQRLAGQVAIKPAETVQEKKYSSEAEALYYSIVNEKSSSLKISGIRSLAQISDKSVQEYLKKLLYSETDRKVREEVMNAIEDNLFILKFGEKEKK